MKKLISLMVAIATLLMVVCSMSVVASADSAPKISVEFANVSNEKFEVGTTFDAVIKYSDVPAYWDNDQTYLGAAFTALVFNLDIPGYGDSIITTGRGSMTPADGFKTCAANFDGTTLLFQWAGNVNGDNTLRESSGTVYTLKLKVAKELTADVAFALSNVKVETIELDDDDKKTGSGLWTSYGTGEAVLTDVSNAKITVAPAGPADEKAITLDEVSVFDECRELGETETTESDTGAAIYAKFAVPDGGVAGFEYKWAMTAGGVRKFSKDAFAVPAGIADGTDCTVAVTFLNGSVSGGVGVAKITNPGLIIKVGKDSNAVFYLSNADDSAFRKSGAVVE